MARPTYEQQAARDQLDRWRIGAQRALETWDRTQTPETQANLERKARLVRKWAQASGEGVEHVAAEWSEDKVAACIQVPHHERRRALGHSIQEMARAISQACADLSFAAHGEAAWRARRLREEADMLDLVSQAGLASLEGGREAAEAAIRQVEEFRAWCRARALTAVRPA